MKNQVPKKIRFFKDQIEFFPSQLREVRVKIEEN